jgi:hypothetical protein
MATPNTSKNGNGNAQKKTAQSSETWEKGTEKAEKAEKAPEPVAAEPAAAEATEEKPAKMPRKKGQRTPLATRLAAAPTPARKAIIIEEQLKMVARRRQSILKMVDQAVLDNVDPTLLA